MKKCVLSVSLVTFITLFVVFYAVYYLLLQDNFLHCSISSIITMSHHLDHKRHLIVPGLLPIYIASVIFGAATLGIYIGSSIQQYIIRCSKKPIIAPKKAF